jgi:hypothetical protein
MACFGATGWGLDQAGLIARMLAAGQSWGTIQAATGCRRAHLAKVAKRAKAAA